ncbi:MAG TPA: alpha/beta fold hydrolase [bacterium]|nr:alpha/beta fold hydrolase [bacterium]
MRLRLVFLCLCVTLLLTACLSSAQRTAGDYEAPVSTVVTADGWTLALQHYGATPEPGAPVIVLVPDLYENGRVFALDERHGLADRLAAHDLGVVVAELRGQGLSEKPAWWNDRRADWTFEAHVRQDLPAIVAAVKGRYAGRKIVLAGHGLGGLACFAYAAAESDEIAALAGWGVADGFGPLNELHRALLARLDHLALLGAAPTHKGATAPAPFIGTRESLFDVLLCNGRSLARPTVARYYERALEPMSIGVARQAARWAERNEWTSYDGRIDYRAGLPSLVCPVLLLSGGQDNLFPAVASREMLDRIGSADKRHRVFDRASRYRDDYGHAGLLIGEEADDEVGDYFRQWVESL